MAQSLSELYERALARSESYLSAQVEVRQARANLRIRAGQAWPTVSATIGANFTAQPRIDGLLDRLPDQSPSLSLDRSLGLSVQQPLFQFGRHDAELKRDELLVQVAWLRLAKTQGIVQRELALAYLSANAGAALMEAQDAQAESLLALLRQTRERFDAGYSPMNAVLAAEVDYRQSLINMTKARQRASEAQRRLNRLTYLPDTQVLEREVAHIDAHFPRDRDEAILFALENNIDVLIARTRVRAARAGLWATARSNLPSLSWSASHSRSIGNTQMFDRPHLNDNGISDIRRQNSGFGVQVSIPIFQGGIQREQRANAQDQVSMALRDLNLTRENLQADLFEQWATIEQEQEILVQWRQLIALEEQKLSNAETLLDQGYLTLDEIQSAYLRLHQLQNEVLTTQHAIHIAQFEILAAMGVL